MSEKKWVDYSDAQRGRFIRYYYKNMSKLYRQKLKDTPFSGKGLNLEPGEYPSQVEMGKLHTEISKDPGMTKFMDYLGWGFRDDISDEDIGLLFGNTKDLASDTLHAADLNESFISGEAARESGIAARQIKNIAETKAITEPIEFLKDKAAKEKEIDRQALDVYKKSLDIYTYNYQYSKEKAQRKAKEDMETYRNGLIKKLNLLYGKENIAKAEKHIIKV